MKETKKLQESDLYKPIQSHFLKEGYEVYGEVKDCDMAAIKDDELILIELKLNLSVDLLIQATNRQRLSELVYIAIPRPKKYNPRSKRWRNICQLVRRLELGLILISFSGNRKKLEFIFDPTPFNRKKSMAQNKRKRQEILKEIDGRSQDFNIGGSSRTQIMTAYRENCIQIACYLEKVGELSPKALIQMGTGKKTSSILIKNYYGWFVRVRRGIYVLSDKGRIEMKQYPDLINYYKNLIRT
ncbi:DUF2161 domain-containing phosphodiesterase [Aquibacillus rhizosphaerae]|uniref:DUF2161 family putative PD-(D/E)XK-type phosphodiesterase n=1 Tax=Aquibacillus rhizosphaerae TaxID=3051431 RepID=A0ABT7L1T5_9BACI|nr:DUF2161 family putative PD-(D/E)XK-type phosphodiesterase [Aquibacillus sp. LR5S19]MDL4839801.1 DUF2161 family putative PD-(D/E)XK-type phosphodiesterase [Aquibacillus sp. LR5S19]